MTQPANHPLTRAYVKGRHDWGDARRKNAISSLNRWVTFLAGHGLDPVDATRSEVDDYLTLRFAQVKSTSVRSDYLYLLGFYRWAVAEEEIETRHQLGPMHNIKAPRADAPSPERTKVCSGDDYATLMASFRVRSLVDCRNAAMCSLMYRTGLRSIEVARCDIDRLHLTTEPPTIEMLGKNDEYRKIPLTHETVVWIERYLRRLGDRVPESGALFRPTYNGTLNARLDRMSATAIRDTIRYRAEALGLGLTAHQFRRAFAVDARRRGINDSTIISIAGWTDGRMLAHYTRSQKNELAVAEFAAADPTAIPADAIRRAADTTPPSGVTKNSLTHRCHLLTDLGKGLEPSKTTVNHGPSDGRDQNHAKKLAPPRNSRG